MAVSLQLFLTAVASMNAQGSKQTFYPSVLCLMVKNGLLAFGDVVTLIIGRQRMAGTIEVSKGKVIHLHILADLVADAVNYLTLTASLNSWIPRRG